MACGHNGVGRGTCYRGRQYLTASHPPDRDGQVRHPAQETPANHSQNLAWSPKFQPHPTVKTKLGIVRIACTLWVTQDPPPTARFAY